MIITSLGTRPQSIAFIEEFIQMTGESVYSLALDRRMDVKNIVYKEKYKFSSIVILVYLLYPKNLKKIFFSARQFYIKSIFFCIKKIWKIVCFDIRYEPSLVLSSFDPYTDRIILELYAQKKKIPFVYFRAYGESFTRVSAYMPESRTRPSFCEFPNVLESAPGEKLKLNKLNKVNKVVIFAHEFFDAPAIMGKAAFESYWDWITHTIDISIENCESVLVKRHPVGIDAKNIRVWEKLKEKYCKKEVVFLEDNIAAVDLMNEETLAITFRGTVSLELIKNGYQVVNCAESPFSKANLVELKIKKIEYMALLRSIFEHGLPERDISQSDILKVTMAFNGSGLSSLEKYDFSFDMHPDTKSAGSVLMRMPIERDPRYVEKWKEYYRSNGDYKRAVEFIQNLCL